MEKIDEKWWKLLLESLVAKTGVQFILLVWRIIRLMNNIANLIRRKNVIDRTYNK